MQAIVLIGPQASGKSSFCRAHLFSSHVRLNLDMLRTRHRERVLLEACIAAKQAMVIDNTNPTRADRARYLPALRAAGFGVLAYWFDDSYERCAVRNEAREGQARVPEVGLKHYFARFQRPRIDEGFDGVFRVQAEGGDFLIEACPDEV
ncbi:AAA family ATPase [Chitinimonas sp.]|uniref:AAA family ATPase n=1 Tax=Chitinimonas sp. TaxID=1934313 RepID=UPI0035B2689F